MTLSVRAPAEYNRRNEFENREQVARELANTYKKDADLIVPFGRQLIFYGASGNKVAFGYDSGAFTFSVDDGSASEIATEASLSDLESSLTTTLTTAYQDADATLYGTVTTEYTTAVNTVNNKLTASYGITVDVNGRIAQLKLLSDGTTSAVKFLASTFQVYNGSTDEAPFIVEGGVVKAKKVQANSVTATEINVSTLSAITANLGTITAGQLNLTSGSYVVRHGAGFGASSDLVMWYGPSSTAIGSATKTNGIFALATDGKVYYGGAELSGAAAATLSASVSNANQFFNPGGSSGSGSTSVTSVTGGSTPYTYSWSKVSGDSQMSFSTTGSGGKDLIPSVSGAGFSTVYSAVYECIITDNVGSVRTVRVSASAQWT